MYMNAATMPISTRPIAAIVPARVKRSARSMGICTLGPTLCVGPTGWTLCVLATRSVGRAFPRGAWERGYWKNLGRLFAVAAAVDGRIGIAAGQVFGVPLGEHGLPVVEASDLGEGLADEQVLRMAGRRT